MENENVKVTSQGCCYSNLFGYATHIIEPLFPLWCIYRYIYKSRSISFRGNKSNVLALRETDLKNNMAAGGKFVSILCPLRGQSCWIQIERWNILSIKGSRLLTSDLIAPECCIVTANITRPGESLTALLSHTITPHRGLYSFWQHPAKLSVSIHPSYHFPIGGTQRWCCSLLYETQRTLRGPKAVSDNKK